MYILKGVLIGGVAFFLFTMFYLYQVVYSHLPKAPAGTVAAVDFRLLQLLTMQRPLYWAALVLTIITACVFERLLRT